MRHLAIHDPDAYKDQAISFNRNNDSTQLIEDEEEEEEEDEDEEDSSQMLVPNESDEEQTLSFTLDPQTQQILQNTNGEQVVVFEVVQVNNNGQETDSTTLPDNQMLVDHVIQAKGKAKARYAIGRQNGANGMTFPLTWVQSFADRYSSTDNYIIQLTEDAEAANTIEEDNIIEDPDYQPKPLAKLTAGASTSAASALISQATSIPPPPIVNDDNKYLRDQLQKQKDLADCFGFKVCRGPEFCPNNCLTNACLRTTMMKMKPYYRCLQCTASERSAHRLWQEMASFESGPVPSGASKPTTFHIECHLAADNWKVVSHVVNHWIQYHLVQRSADIWPNDLHISLGPTIALIIGE